MGSQQTTMIKKISGVLKNRFGRQPKQNWLDSWEDGEGPQIRTKQELDAFFERFASCWDGHEEEVFAGQCRESETKSVGVPGYCQVCDRESPFTLEYDWSDGTVPNFRESMFCPYCSLNSRQRKMAATVKRWAKQQAGQGAIYMYEQLTKAYEAVCAFSDSVTGSEYIAGDMDGGTVVDGVRHEDAEHLSFADESFDILVSCDVFEHVNQYTSCFEEANRILKPQGRMFLSVPFYLNKQENFRRCGFEGGQLKHYAEPSYHFNPISKEGSLVFWDYGWDMLADLKRAGFSDVYMQPYYSRKFGYMGEIQYYFIVTK